MNAGIRSFIICFLLFPLSSLLFAGTGPCTATNYQLSDFGITRTYTLDNGTFDNIADPGCGDYQGQDFWVMFTGPTSGLVNIELLDGSITDAAFEVYWNACNGLSASIGCFADRNCGANLMPGANLEVLPGETYHVRIFQEGGGTGTLDFRMSDLGGSEFSLGGDATVYDSGVPNQRCFQLTTETNNQVGCAWFDTPIDFSSGFEINYQLFFGDIDDNGADGIAFVFHTDPTPPCDNAGGQLGVVGISNSFIVEFDTWTNPDFGDNIPQDHAAININGFIDIPVAAPVPIGVNGNVEDGMFHDVTISWDPTTNLFLVIFDGVEVIRVDISAIINLLPFFTGSDPVFWGLTGTTGGAFNDQIFCFDGFEIENTNSVETRIDEIICDGDPFVFNGEVLFDPDTYVEVFPASNGCDSTVTLTLELVEIMLDGDDMITIPCGEDEVSEIITVDLESNVDLSGFSFTWNTDDGVIESGENSLMLEVSAPGTYILTAEYDFLGCEEEFVVEVNTTPAPELGLSPAFLSCDDNANVVLNSFFDETENEIIWTTMDGNIVGEDDIVNPTVDTIGIYTATITNSITGCTSSASLEVFGPGSAVVEPQVSFCPGTTEEIFLNAELFGEIQDFVWMPASGLNAATSINPQVLDLSSPQTFTLEVSTRSDVNLVFNSTFALGNTGFTSDYQEGIAASGRFLITNDPTEFFPSFSECDDNSNTDDMMMVVDGDVAPNQQIWCQEIDVTSGVEYVFSFWYTNLCESCANQFPELSLTINGLEVNTPIVFDGEDCVWERIEANPWIADENTAEICITNLNQSTSGNDLAIDDLEFYELCKTTHQVEVFPLNELGISIDPAEIVCQADSIVVLNANPIGDDLIDFSWSWVVFDENGIFLENTDSASPTVQGPGTYFVTLIDNLSGCFIVDSIVLEVVEFDFPDFSLSGNDLTCDQTSSQIAVEGLDLSNFSFEWSNANGTFIDNNDGSIEALDGGEYFVTLTNLSNNCTEMQSISISSDENLPEVNIAPVDTLTCSDIGESFLLEGAFIVNDNPSVTLVWTTIGGNILSGEDSESVEVSGSGTYVLEVINNDNGCSSSATIEVAEDLTPPDALLIGGNSLDCNITQTDLLLQLPGNSDFSFEWTSIGGNIITDTNLSQITVDRGGEYQVLITDNITGCTTPLNIMVEENLSLPNFDIEPLNSIDCNNTETQIIVNGTDLAFQWTSDPNIISALDGNSISVIDGGNYSVLLTNALTGCDTTINISVDSDFTQPNVEAGSPQTFGCADQSLFLSGSSSSNIAAIDWQTAGGLIISGQNTLTPEIGGAGIYFLSITGDNGCISRDSVIVEPDNDIPNIAQIDELTLDCNTLEVILDATSSSSGMGFSFEWRDQNGDLITDFTTLNPIVSEVGEYQLSILNNDNGCSAETIISVIGNFDEPNAPTTSVDALTCMASSSIFGLETSNPNWTYSWSNTNGIIMGENQFQLEASMEDTYILTVTDQSNGCTSEFNFDLISSVNNPSLSFDGPTVLSCLESEITIIANSDATNPTYSWQTADGSILSSTDASMVQVNGSGTYEVTITDGLTGCIAIDQIEISSNSDAPVIEIQEPDNLTCDVDEILLISNVTNVGADIDFIWSTDDGILSSPNGGGNISVSSPGTYTLTIINNENGCENTSSIIVEESVSTFLINIDMPDMLDCDISEIILNAEEVMGGNIEYLWTTIDGNIVDGADGLNPTVNQGGEYILTVTDANNGCSFSSSIIVGQDGDVPLIELVQPDDLSCVATTQIIDATGSSEGLDFLVQWTTLNGNIISGNNTLTPTVDQDGDYLLTITNVINNCEVTQLVSIDINETTPVIDFEPIDDINCDSNGAVVIAANLLSMNTNVSYEWTTNMGSIVGENNLPSVQVDAEGQYILVITDLENGCSDTFTAEVVANMEVPDVSINSPEIIDCTNMQSTITLDIPTSNQNLIFNWSTDDGAFTGDADSSEIIATMEGNYSVTITDTQSNCEVVLTAFVEADREVPDLNFIAPDTINCVNSIAVINTQTDLNGLIYSWTTEDGSIVSATNGEDLVVDASGTYTLVVINSANNCPNTIEVEVFEDIELPVVEIEPALDLTCIIEEQSLSGNGSSMGNEFEYLWTSPTGSIVSGGTTLNPLIAAPGLYTLQVTNIDNNCVQVDSILVSENTLLPLAGINPPDIINCINETVILSTDASQNTNFVFEWTTPDGNIISDPTMPTVEVDMPGTYELTLVDNINGCDNILLIDVIADLEPPLLELMPGFTLTCDNTDGLLSVESLDPNAILTWTNSQGEILSTDNSVVVDAAGIYSATAVSAINGCVTNQEVEVFLNENVPTDLIAEIIPPLCFGETGSIDLIEVVGGEGPYLFSIDGGQSFGDLTTIDNLSAGTINEIIVMDINGCEFDTEFTIPNVQAVTVDLPVGADLLIGEAFQILVETSIPLDEIAQIIWTPETGLSCTDCLNPTVTPSASIDYQVEIINTNGCSDIATIQLRVDRNQDVYIPNAFSPFNEDGFNDFFYVYTKEGVVSQIQSLQVYDRWGNQVFLNENFSPNEATSGWNGTFRNERMQPGVFVYYTIVEFQDGSTELFKGDVTLME